ncbi:hypothetical protein SAMN05660964_01478 [Thiothrix caldifontis]|uniref:Uncharacterized protein n=2 Tax=Thiothrix caldifontis TaxID=525918 RepID=A0A1H4ATM6_9GAMM|nr:hypothetical protein SAMN05660964_01478 [Thiothrix caldifontis]
MIYYKHNGFIHSIHKLYQKDGDYRRAAMVALAIMAKSQESDVFNDALIIDKLNTVTIQGISGKLYNVYDLPKSCRLVVAIQDQEKILLFVGNHDTFQTWKADTLKAKFAFSELKKNSKQLSKIAQEETSNEETLSEEAVEFNFDDFIKQNPDSVEAKIKQAIDTLISQSSENKVSRKNLRNAIKQYRQDIKEYYSLLEHQNPTSYDNDIPDEMTVNAEVDKVITTIDTKHHAIVTHKVEDAFSLIKAHQLENGLVATKTLKDEVDFIEIKVKYAIALESLVENIKAGISLEEKTKLINDVINENLIDKEV